MRTFHVRVADRGNGYRQVDIVEDPSGESADLDLLEKYIREVSSTLYTREEVNRLLQLVETRRAEQDCG